MPRPAPLPGLPEYLAPGTPAGLPIVPIPVNDFRGAAVARPKEEV